jgi:DNA-binding transcriptional LysR family regulator
VAYAGSIDAFHALVATNRSRYSNDMATVRADGHAMERARQVRAIWDYLPAFRAVAEAQHLPTAARALHVSASALSRAIRLAEAQVGTALFERGGRAMRLNAAGHALLGAVRDAMRLIDEGVGALAGAGLVGNVIVAASGDVASWLVAPALARLRAAEPDMTGELVPLPADLVSALRCGDVDVVVSAGEISSDDVEVEALTAVRWSVFGAAGGRGEAYQLVAVAGAAFPARHPVHIAARVPDVVSAAAACHQGLVAWLPAPLATRHGLVRVRGAPVEVQTVHATWRRPVATHARTEAALTALREVARAPGRSRRGPRGQRPPNG